MNPCRSRARALCLITPSTPTRWGAGDRALYLSNANGRVRTEIATYDFTAPLSLAGLAPA
jgi:hypothetical protein